MCLINSLLLFKLLFPLHFYYIHCILCRFILFSAAVQYYKRRYTNSFYDCDFVIVSLFLNRQEGRLWFVKGVTIIPSENSVHLEATIAQKAK